MKPSLSWLLVFVPITVGLHFLAPGAHLWIFLSACAAIIPLAGWMGRATEHLAKHTGEGLGGLLSATFGNAAELIIAFAALREGNVVGRQGVAHRLDPRQPAAGARRLVPRRRLEARPPALQRHGGDFQPASAGHVPPPHSLAPAPVALPVGPAGH